MEEAKQLEQVGQGGRGADDAAAGADEDDRSGLWEHARRRPLVALLPDGSWHSCCTGQHCPYTERNGEGQFVCKYTGVFHEADLDGNAEWYDLNGGTGHRVDDADNHNESSSRAAISRHARTCRSRANSAQQSLAAYSHAMVADDRFEVEHLQWGQHVATQARPREAKCARAPARRRVALCVDVSPCASEITGGAAPSGTSLACAAHEREREREHEHEHEQRHGDADAGPVHEADRARLSVRNPHFQGPPEQLEGLFKEVQLVIDRLINYREAASYKRPAKGDTPCTHAADARGGAQKPQDEHTEWMASVRKYTKQCLARGVAPSIDAVHNLSLMVHAARAAARAELAAQHNIAAIRTVRFRDVCSTLVVKLWRACCNTSYLLNARRGTDSFRPFVCGVLYAFKRGLVLANGSVLVPQCPHLAAALPVLGSTGGNTMAKTLRSSSHRGMCTLLKCIASVPPEEQNALFAEVVTCAAQFAATRFAANDI
jgi:hypothetical protein